MKKDPSLLYMINKILPLSTYYDKISQYLNLNNNLETGLISKAFCDGIRKILREYVLFINQLEIEFNIDNLDIQKLWYLSQPSLRLLENLQRLCYQASLIKGGNLLNVIYGFYQNTTDTELKGMYKLLLDKAFEPYLVRIRLWVCKGLLEDKYDDFMIVSNSEYSKENLAEHYLDFYWDKKFLLNKENVPEFINIVADKILFIGKALNVLLESGNIVYCPYEAEFEVFKNQSLFDVEVSNNFQHLIDKTYEWTNSTLITLFFKEENIVSIIKSMKKFYLMECGDFFTHMIDLADELLLQPKNTISFEKLVKYLSNNKCI